MPKYLIINADDLGNYPGATRGILEAAEGGIVKSASLLVNFPGSEEAAMKALQRKVDLGLHFNLTHGNPISSPETVDSLVNDDGVFYLKREEIEEKGITEHIQTELKAQLELFTKLTSHVPSHINTHKHIHRWNKVLKCVVSIAKETNLPVRSSSAMILQKLKQEGIPTTDFFLGDVTEEPYWTKEKLLEALSTLQPGVAELMCHPGHYDKTAEDLTFYNRQRETELEAFCGEEVMGCVAKQHIQLITFKELASPAKFNRA